MKYDDVIRLINEGKISKIDFEVIGYPHYNNCSIKRYKDTLPNGNSIIIIVVQLTLDATECISFLNSFNESYKLFHFGKKGNFTLKDLWKKINIKNIM